MPLSIFMLSSSPLLSSAADKPIIVAITGATGLGGGIACLNRNILRSFDRLIAPHVQKKLIILSLHESSSDRPDFLSPTTEFHAFYGDKTRFSLALLRWAPRSSLVFFDHVALSYPIWPLARAGLIKSVIFAHGPEAWMNVRRRSMASYRAAHLVLTNSEFTLRKMRTRFSGFSAEACPLGLNPDIPLHQSIPLPPEKAPKFVNVDGQKMPLSDRALLLVGRMDRRQRGKGHRELIHALPTILQAHPRTQLVFPGTGNARQQFIELARKQGVARQVFFPGFVSAEKLELLYRHAYAFVMPSRQDGFGLVYLEAMNFGLPCIGSYDDGGECVVVDGKTGYLVDPQHGEAGLIEVLDKLLTAPYRARQMGVAGFKRLHNEFTAEAFQTRLADKLLPRLSPPV